MTKEDFMSLVWDRLQENSTEGITGWGLRNPDPQVFSLVVTSPVQGCRNERCGHMSHDSAAPVVKLTPLTGWTLHDLGSNGGEGRFYVAVSDGVSDGVKAYCFSDGGHYWDHISECAPEAVPHFLWEQRFGTPGNADDSPPPGRVSRRSVGGGGRPQARRRLTAG